MAGWIQVVNDRITAVLRQALLAAQFLTTFPLPNLSYVSEAEIRLSSMFFPLVGVVLGIILWAMEFLLRLVFPNLVSTSIALTLYTLLTGALHLDGLMDTADALGSRKPRERALEIMKDSRVGAMGVVAAVMVYSGKLAALNACVVFESSLSTNQGCLAFIPTARINSHFSFLPSWTIPYLVFQHTPHASSNSGNSRHHLENFSHHGHASLSEGFGR